MFRTLVLLPMAIPPLVGGYMWRYLYDPSLGAVHALLLSLHLEMAPGILDLVYHLFRRFLPYQAFPGPASRFLPACKS